jgi:hypothetical protein
MVGEGFTYVEIDAPDWALALVEHVRAHVTEGDWGREIDRAWPRFRWCRDEHPYERIQRELSGRAKAGSPITWSDYRHLAGSWWPETAEIWIRLDDDRPRSAIVASILHELAHWSGADEAAAQALEAGRYRVLARMEMLHR